MHQDGRQAMDDAHQQWVEAERLSAAQPSMHVHQSEIRNGIVFRDNILQQPREKEAKHFEHVTAVVIGAHHVTCQRRLQLITLANRVQNQIVDRHIENETPEQTTFIHRGNRRHRI